jgi:hypothetical protein
MTLIRLPVNEGPPRVLSRTAAACINVSSPSEPRSCLRAPARLSHWIRHLEDFSATELAIAAHQSA